MVMKSPVVIIGIGELGSVFARGLLRTAHPVYPILRGMDPAEEARHMPEPEAVLVATGEADLHPVLEKVPPAWQDRLVLLQNELLPRDWEAHGIARPTVIAVWFEKKKGMDVKVLLPSPVWGPHAALIAEALAAIDIPALEVATAEAMTLELAAKNLYILTTNIAGLVLPEGATVEELHTRHAELERVPAAWQDRLVLLQNELLPRDWEAHGIARPTVIAVWFEKKKGMDVKVLLPSPVWGPHAALIAEALAAIDIPALEVATAETMTLELVAKNLYILTTNIAGLVLPEGATVEELHARHAELERAVADEVLAVQEWLVGRPLDRAALLRKLEAA
ncbi:MAG: hypothetical protein D6818_05555, partial [Bacteroidetes bacterium]